MGRLIEIEDARECPAPLAVRVGDVILFHAAGGRVESGRGVVEMWGPFLRAVLGDDGRVLAPAGTPNTVLFRARRPGRATVAVITGGPWHAPQAASVSLSVDSA